MTTSGILRARAAGTLLEIVSAGRALDPTLAAARKELADAREQALLQEIVYGVLRWYERLDYQLGCLLARPLRPRDEDVRQLLLAGLYQLLHLDLAPHAVVNETVAASTALRKDWARGLVNGVLRNAQRRREELEQTRGLPPAARWLHPIWLIDALGAAWPEAWREVLQAGSARPPLTLRVNRLRTDRDTCLARFAAAGHAAEPNRHAPDAIRLTHPVPVESLPGFAAGELSVQDEAAQLAAPLLDAAPGMCVLDACAAPGGKTTHLLELVPEARVTALDIDRERLMRVAENLARTGLVCELLCGDASTPAAWAAGRRFDRILLDAPCSATGVIRRHPDIKRHRRAEDIPALAATQARLLRALWPVLAPGGKLLYATCSVLPEENDDVVAAFVVEQPEARVEPIDAAWGMPQTCGRQILTGQDGMDGFYYALLSRCPAA